MDRLIILGCGAAPGVPTISDGWGECDPQNPKNRRSRAGVYVEISGVKILIDTSADIRNQMIDNHIREVDGVLYTHAHADHIMGIDFSIFLNSTPEETLAHRRARARDGKTDSAFTSTVLRLEQIGVTFISTPNSLSRSSFTSSTLPSTV